MTSFDDDDYSFENVSSEASIPMTWTVTTNDSISTVVTPASVMTTVISTTIATTTSTSLSSWLTTSRIQIILYITILLLAIIGNALVILTLIQNRRMRTITNVFLLNLAISDILLGVLCMPITLIGTLLRDFVFGEVMCKLLPYLQASSVAVSAWTLVAIALERYFAICEPLRSRQWQTLKHAYKLIALIWCGSFLFMLPIAVFSQLIPTTHGHHKCREQWPDSAMNYERAFNLFLDVILLIFPLIMLSTSYFCITKTLWQGMTMERTTKRYTKSGNNNYASRNSIKIYLNTNGHSRGKCSLSYTSKRKTTFSSNSDNVICYQIQPDSDSYSTITDPHVVSSKKLSVGLRRTNTEKSLQNKKRVIKMLFVVVLEFFISWTPLYIINTIAMFDPNAVYQKLGYTTISYFQLLAYTSSCCNPITYCFMNRGFRKACLNLFRCCKRFHETRRISIGGGPIGVTQSSEVT
ncbi:cholecystokinin receptor type A-like [Contarinia nasturtii]|uniref:cholecystokinin receptor type A-like n=1 Tax=Contarinia nasturtii TaxID=265458 RepID=UPI0012D44F61|nr:cholecystokinin receptor type A-like [Contarinia nasturtii]